MPESGGTDTQNRMTEIPEFPAETRRIALSASEFAAAGSRTVRFFLKNSSDAVLHIKLTVDASYLTITPTEAALGPGERQMAAARLELDAARNAVKAGGSPAAPVRLAYQQLRPGETGAASVAVGSGDVFITLPYATCPACGRTLEIPDGAMPDACPFCYERLRPCPVCAAPNSWLARCCIKDASHIIRSAPDWGTLGGGTQHTGASEERVPAALTRRWSFPSVPPSRRENALAWSAPVTAYGIVAAAAATTEGEAHLYAFDTRNGAPLWDAYPLAEPVYPDRGGCALSGGRLYAATVEGVCVAVDAQRGTRIWERDLPGKVYGAIVPAGDDDSLLIPLTVEKGGAIIALNAATGEPRWIAKLSGPPDTAPSIAEGRVFAHDDKGNLTAIALTDGAILWTVNKESGFNAAPIIADGAVFSATENGSVFRTEPSTGAEIWRLTVTNAPFSGTPACDGTLLYLPAEDGLHLVSAAAGRAVRRYPLRLPVRSAPIIAGGTLLFGCLDGTVYGAAAGRNLEKLYETGATGSQIIAAPALNDGAFFVAATNGVLYALGFPTPQKGQSDGV